MAKGASHLLVVGDWKQLKTYPIYVYPDSGPSVLELIWTYDGPFVVHEVYSFLEDLELMLIDHDGGELDWTENLKNGIEDKTVQ
jgi:hypothetical protein